MNITPFSFGKKIPLMHCNVKDVRHDKFAEVTLSEYDCKDYSDIQEVNDQCKRWEFGFNIADDMNIKRMDYLKGYEQYPTNYYVMEDKNKKIIGLCETVDFGNDTNIEFIESKRNSGYKYIGQAMLAMVGKILLNKGKENLCVAHSYIEAVPFYIDKCGFDSVKDDKHIFSLFMNNQQIKDFIERVQTKTNAPIKEINE